MSSTAVHLPRVEITFCVACKWNLRAAYYAQELLQTFCSPSAPSGIVLGEIALVPVQGGIFTIDITLSSDATGSEKVETTVVKIWDRKIDGGFPEVKDLKDRVRKVVDPGREMGHVDRALAKAKSKAEAKDDKAGGTGAGAEAEQVDGKKEEESSEQGKVVEVEVEVQQGDCEECRIDAREKLEDEIGRVTSH